MPQKNLPRAQDILSRLGEKEDKISAFSFPLDKHDLLKKRIQFANRADWAPTKHLVSSIKYFEENFIIRGKRNKLNWKLDPIPKVHSAARKRPLLLQSSSELRKPQLTQFYS